VSGIALNSHNKVGNVLSVKGFIRQQLQCATTAETVFLIQFQAQLLVMQLLIGYIMSLKRKQKNRRKVGEVNALDNSKQRTAKTNNV
jgi:hypothetical protein